MNKKRYPLNAARQPEPASRACQVSPADRAKGQAAEITFREWLDADVLPHLYIDQTPMTVPEPMRGRIKRPDYLVGIPGAGMIAFDVKAKTIYRDELIFDLEEVRKLRTFARVFHLTVYFACLDPLGGPSSYWVRLDQLDNAPAERRGGDLTLSIPLRHAQPVSLRESFHSAFVRAVALA